MKKGTGLKKFLYLLLFLVVLVTVLYSLQYYFGIFDSQLKAMKEYIASINSMVFQKWVAGISMGTMFCVVLLLLIPLFTKDIDTRMYFKNVKQGILASFIFYISQLIYGYLEKFNKFYMVVSIIGVIIITAILIQSAGKAFKDEKDSVEFKTGYISSITAGLIFGILLKLSLIGIEAAKVYINHQPWQFFK